MKNIKAIAFDLGWVFIKENDFLLSPQEEILERQLWRINEDEEYIERAMLKLWLSRAEVIKSIEMIILNIYELRDESIFTKLPKLKFAIASNHLSYIHKRLKKKWVEKYFDVIIISADIHLEKPNPDFFKILISKLNELPQEILFVDDDENNINAAKKLKIQTLHYDRWKDLASEVLKKL